MSRIRLLTSTYTRPTLAMLAVLLLLFGSAFPGTARADHEETQTTPCVQGLELPDELAEDELVKLRGILQALVDANPEATVTLLSDGEETSTVRADLLLADDAVLVALIEGKPVNVTVEFPQGDDELEVIVAIEVSAAADCADESCGPIELPAALADLDVAGLRQALEELIAADADATVNLPIFGEEFATVRADLLIDLADPVLGAVLAGDLLGFYILFEGETAEIIGIDLPSPECERTGGPPDAEPKPGTMPDNQQDGSKDTTPDNQQGGGDKVPNNQQTGGDKDTGAGGKTPDNQQGGGKTPDNQQGGSGKGTVTKTFELTLNGTVPQTDYFTVTYSVRNPETSEPLFDDIEQFCGSGDGTVPCEGAGTVYTTAVEVPRGSELSFAFMRSSTSGGEDDEFHSGTETLNANMTNTAWYTYGTGAGDDKQTGDGKDTSVGDDEQTPDNQQDDTADDAQDDQQGEVPEELPETGAGGLAAGATIAAAGLTMLMGAGYAVLRRR